MARFWGTQGVCRRPDPGRRKLRQIADPWLPRVRQNDHCGDWTKPPDFERQTAERAKVRKWQ